MKNIYKTILFVGLAIVLPFASHTQVVMAEYLSQNHEGQIPHAVNNNGKALYYKFEYKNTDNMRINYTLYLYKDAAKKQPFLILPVLMRNLTWTYYLDITFAKNDV